AQHPVLTEHLDGFGFTGTMDTNLAVRNDAEPVFEADDSAVIQAEKIAREVAKVAVAERADEAVRDAERALEQRQSERRRQTNQREIGLGWLECGVVILRDSRSRDRGSHQQAER